ncbi:MAG: RsmB/NOP family class I SAM-dependent RNA methyltransferase [Solobacterium sp.]|nr:RsmB/NOP family class I SAM-dependent RNA methyltransferase [Solobacterium sp.]
MKLPDTYQSAMKALLKEEYDDYLAALEQPACRSLRVNPLKISPQEFEKVSPFPLSPVPWCREGFYVEEETRIGLHPYYNAGLYYIQEASAMSPAAFLPVEEGDIVLDACCAPGGKSTALAAKLNGTGMLIANDISASRQNATLKNIERFGIRNAYVISEDMRSLETRFPAFFDKILLDAPCSGEGMFRKEPDLIKAWLEKDSAFYVPIQKDLLLSAWKMLKEGGSMVYSTCTFDPREDEEVIAALLEKENDAEIIPLHGEGFAPGIGLSGCARLYPHRLKGEGHFVCLLHKQGQAEKTVPAKTKGDPLPKDAAAFLKHASQPMADRHVIIQKDRILLVPDYDFHTEKLRILRSGLLLGTMKNNRFEPAQHLAFALSEDSFDQVVSLAADDPRTEKYLKAETISFDTPYRGWVLVTVDSYPLGFGKAEKGTIKNKLEKGFRRL